MSLSFPRTDILTDIDIGNGQITPMFRNESSRTQGGVTLVKELGPMLWRAMYQTNPMERPKAMDLETDLMSLKGGIELFEGYDPRRPVPLTSSDSDNLSGVTVGSISNDRTSLSLSGLPSGFVISKSDYLSVNDGLNLHLLKAMETVQANGSGVLSDITVFPFVRPAILVGQSVTLRKASARFQVDAGSVSRNQIDAVLDSVSFTAVQVIL